MRENRLALSDDVWLSIDHNNSETLEEGVQFQRAYNEKMAAFNALASELSTVIGFRPICRRTSFEHLPPRSGGK